MLIFFGTRKVRIRTFTDEAAPCVVCGDHRKQYRIYQPCFHIFWIPVFPIGRKYMVTTCTQCKGRYEVHEHPKLSATRTPLYMFSVLLLVAAFFVFGFISSHQTSKKTEEYVRNPAAGDIYLLEDVTDGKKTYYFSKIFQVEPDSVYFQVGAYEYTRYTASMDTADYFVSDYYYAVYKPALEDWYRGGVISKIERTGKP